MKNELLKVRDLVGDIFSDTFKKDSILELANKEEDPRGNVYVRIGGTISHESHASFTARVDASMSHNVFR